VGDLFGRGTAASGREPLSRTSGPPRVGGIQAGKGGLGVVEGEQGAVLKSDDQFQEPGKEEVSSGKGVEEVPLSSKGNERKGGRENY